MSSRSPQMDMFVPELGLQTVTETLLASPVSDATLSLRRQEQQTRRQLLLSRKRGDLVEQAACWLRLGDIELARGDSERAGDLYRHALKLSQAAHETRQVSARARI
jgi:hypothetical protein